MCKEEAKVFINWALSQWLQCKKLSKDMFDQPPTHFQAPQRKMSNDGVDDGEMDYVDPTENVVNCIDFCLYRKLLMKFMSE